MKRRTVADRLAELAESDFYPCHMPGHKRNLSRAWMADGGCETTAAQGKEQEAFSATAERSRARDVLDSATRLDITEIDGFDNLHEPEGILREAMARAARLYGAGEAWYSVNGSTAGILTAVSAAVARGGKLIMARDCHKAVYHAVCLRDIRPVYLWPDTVPGFSMADAVTARQVERALIENPDAAAVLITSPTYDGITADVKEIARLAHDRGIPLIVDAAHGAHFGLHPSFPESPVRLGADLTAVSLHKTLPAMTQTALLLQTGGLVDRARIRLYESMFQTSSPSYFLMAGMDECITLLLEKGAALWNGFFQDRESFMKKTAGLKRLRILTAGRMPAASGVSMDPGKLLIQSGKTDLTGKQIYDILLERYHLQMEMAAGDYVTAIMTCCDRIEGWNRLADALCEIDARAEEAGAGKPGKTGASGVLRAAEPSGGADAAAHPYLYPRLEQAFSIAEALDAGKEPCPLKEAAGTVSAGFISLYPPGIPIVVPGERISREAVDIISRYGRMQLPVQGVCGGAITIIKKTEYHNQLEKEILDEKNKNCLHDRTGVTG